MVSLYNKVTTTMAAINSEFISSPHRPYLGMSMIGHNCERFLWYTFRWCYEETYPARINRLFERGHSEEYRIIQTLNKVGIKVFDKQEEVEAIHGHCKGHIDGKCIGVIEAPKTIHLSEFKTMSDKYFKEIKKSGVFSSKPIYYAQMQTYMHHLNLTRALFVAVNKNDDDMYIERVKYDKDHAIRIMRRAESIILSEQPPKKRFSPTWYECKYCSAKSICHGSDLLDSNCRTCIYGDIVKDGKWECSYHEITLVTDQQRLPCKNYKQIQVVNDDI